MHPESHPNIFVFGETGVGKSSVVNMLDDFGGIPNKARASSSAAGVSKQDICYEKTIGRKNFNVFDTAGFNQGEGGTVAPKVAFEKLNDLIYSPGYSPNLLVLVVRANHPSFNTIHQIHKIFYEIICDKKVPIVIFIIGLEFERDTKGWLQNTDEAFREQGMDFAASACITTISNSNEGTCLSYQESKEEVEQVIARNWKSPANFLQPIAKKSRFEEAVLKLTRIFRFKHSQKQELLASLLATGHLNKEEAGGLVEKMLRMKLEGARPSD